MTAVARLLTLCPLVLALALSTPVIGWCVTAAHHGQALHPLFDHIHHVAHAHHPATVAEHAAMDHSGENHSHAEHGTSWSATTAFGTAGWMQGIQALLSLSLPLLALMTGRRLSSATLRPPAYVPLPSFPPPRSFG
jgi:uncharacterized protein involved in copper resistance